MGQILGGGLPLELELLTVDGDEDRRGRKVLDGKVLHRFDVQGVDEEGDVLLSVRGGEERAINHLGR